MSNPAHEPIDPLLRAYLHAPTPQKRSSGILTGFILALCLIIAGFTAVKLGYVILPVSVQAMPTRAPIQQQQAPARQPVAQPQSDVQPTSAAMPQQAPAEQAQQEAPRSEVQIIKIVSGNPEASPIAVVVRDLANPGSAPVVMQDGTKRRGVRK